MPSFFSSPSSFPSSTYSYFLISSQSSFSNLLHTKETSFHIILRFLPFYQKKKSFHELVHSAVGAVGFYVISTFPFNLNLYVFIFFLYLFLEICFFLSSIFFCLSSSAFLYRCFSVTADETRFCLTPLSY